MRVVRNTFQFFIAFLLALFVYTTPLFSLILAGMSPDPIDVVIEQAPYREVSLADAGDLLDKAFIPSEQDDGEVTQTEDPTPPTPQDAAPQEATPPETPAPTPPTPTPPPVEAPSEQQQVDQMAREIADARRQQAADARREQIKAKSEALAKQRLEARRAAEAKSSSSGGNSKGKKQKCADPTPGISKINDREFNILRDIVLHYASDLDAASHLAWVAWNHDEDGDIDGFTVKRIRCGTVLDQAGLKNGDIIREVNGKNVNSIVQAFAAWRKVRKKDVVRIKLVRKGEKMEIKYHIE